MIVDLTETLPNNPAAKPWKARSLSSLRWLVVHHTASLEDATPEALNAVHHARGWWRLSYHYMIDVTGQVFKVNRASDITWTVANGNSPTLSVCLIGNREKTPCPLPQWEALLDFLPTLREAYPSIIHLYGHRECPTTPPQATACPGQHLSMSRLRELLTWREEEV